MSRLGNCCDNAYQNEQKDTQNAVRDFEKKSTPKVQNLDLDWSLLIETTASKKIEENPHRNGDLYTEIQSMP